MIFFKPTLKSFEKFIEDFCSLAWQELKLPDNLSSNESPWVQIYQQRSPFLLLRAMQQWKKYVDLWE